MGDFLAIVGQIFWGVTVGALGSAFSWVAKGAMVALGFGGAGLVALEPAQTGEERPTLGLETEICLGNCRHPELVSASIAPEATCVRAQKWTLKQVQGYVAFMS
ncbi:hypothetical protein ACFSTD_04555 [Novosphingobium colocasiae]